MNPASSVKRMGLSSLFVWFLCLAAFGCAGPLKVDYKAVTQAKAYAPVSFAIHDFTDARGEPGTRAIGRLSATVSDMNGARIVLDEDPAQLAARAFREEFRGAGYVVAAGDAAKDADFALDGRVREFRLDIGARDEIAISIEASIIERETGRVVWSGVKTEGGSRFAGVMGNSRDTISNYISASLARVASGVINDAGPLIENTRPAYRPAPAAPMAPTVEGAAPADTGRMVVTSGPVRAKVYIGGVYHGMTPLRLDLAPGIYDLALRSKGHKDASEKVSVRTGQMTEVEMGLEKE
ncbi:MAG: PEGA domain-containing protein [Deltaproteobacteria bacterium]|nr:PEGA domain-containing protein [Deltaproteobacteria bacterium]